MATTSTAVGTARGVVGRATVQRELTALRLAWTQRRDRPWLAMSAVPLAMTASGLMQLWWIWPLLLLVATTCTSASRWSWVPTFQLAVLGTEWAYVGAVALAAWPDQRNVVGAVWASLPLYLAGSGTLYRRLRRSG